jgi:hypothetical protein
MSGNLLNLINWIKFKIKSINRKLNKALENFESYDDGPEIAPKQDSSGFYF